MSPINEEEIKRRFVKISRFETSPEIIARDLGKIKTSLSKLTSEPQKPGQNIWRIIMKSKLTKLAVAAVIILAVLLVLHYSGSSIDGSGVVWADVLKKIENCKGYTNRITFMTDFPSDWKCYYSPEYARIDIYRDEKLEWSLYNNYKSNTTTYIYYNTKKYSIRQRQEDSNAQGNRQDSLNPLFMLRAILSFEHQELESKTIDGVLCEGIETSDMNVIIMMNPEDEAELRSLENPGFHMTLWIDRETQYPVKVEYQFNIESNGEMVKDEAVLDQFKWDVDFDTDTFKPNIPPDFNKMPDM